MTKSLDFLLRQNRNNDNDNNYNFFQNFQCCRVIRRSREERPLESAKLRITWQEEQMSWLLLLLLLMHQNLFVYCEIGSFGMTECLISDISIKEAENSASLL